MKYWPTILKKLLQVSYAETNLDARGFDWDQLLVKTYLEKIACTFLDGYHSALGNAMDANLINNLDKHSDLTRGFAFEGAAMGCVITDALTPFSRHSKFNDLLRSDAGNKHIYMLHIGIGWALARLPGKIESKIEKYDPLLKWLIVDGLGFHQAYFHTDRFVKNTKLPDVSLSSRHIFYQGIGRCLWFVEGTNPERIAARINSFPLEYAGDLWSGIGLASAYAGGVEKDVIEKIKNYSHQYIFNLAQGCAFAAKARVRACNLVPHTNMACLVYTGKNANEAASITDDCFNTITLAESKTSQGYELWRSRISRKFSELNLEIARA